MKRVFGAAAGLVLACAAAAQAHFPFILPEPDGAKARLVFSDELAPDLQVDVEKLSATKLRILDAEGTIRPLEWKKDVGFYTIDVPGRGPRTVFGVTEYGVLQKGDAKPFRLTYLPKAVVGPAPAHTTPIRGELKVEILGDRVGGKTRFQVVHEGKPAAGVEVTVILPGGTKKASKTDADGFTPAYDAAGRYGVYARVTEAKGGEHAGKRYEETRYYATLVLDVPKPAAP